MHKSILNALRPTTRREFLKASGGAAVVATGVTAATVAVAKIPAPEVQKFTLQDDTWKPWGFDMGEEVSFIGTTEPMFDKGLWVVPFINGFTLIGVTGAVNGRDEPLPDRWIQMQPGMGDRHYMVGDADAPQGFRILTPRKECAA